jgi:hypothetical protein
LRRADSRLFSRGAMLVFSANRQYSTLFHQLQRKTNTYQRNRAVQAQAIHFPVSRMFCFFKPIKDKLIFRDLQAIFLRNL